MKGNEIDNLIERLQGFDDEELQREMTDGLDQWCRRRRQRGRAVKRGLLLALLLLTTTAIAMSVVRVVGSREQVAGSGEQVAGSGEQGGGGEEQASDFPIDSVVVRKAAPEPVDYYYTGMAEEGYSVTYGHDSRTLTYTRYSGNHLIHSVVHNSPDIFMSDTVEADTTSVLHPEPPAVAAHSQIVCDFQTVSSQGDALYYVIIDSVRHEVSVRGDVARWMGQPIRYSSLLTLPAAVEHDGLRYTVTALADSAFMGHDELETVCLPATVTRIGDYAFAGCLSLESLAVQAAVPPEAYPASFDRVDALLRLAVPCGSAEAYANDAEWLYFRNILEDCAPRTPSIRVIRKP